MNDNYDIHQINDDALAKEDRSNDRNLGKDRNIDGCKRSAEFHC